MNLPPFPPPPELTGATRPDEPFAPVAPEPFFTPPPPAARRSGGSARGLSIALVAAVIIAGRGVSFAAGRATAPTTVAPPAGAQADVNVPGGQNVGPGGAQFGNGGPLASSVPASNPSFSAIANGDRGAFGRDGFGSPTVSGTVTAVTGSSMTVQLANGATVSVGLDGSTTYHQQTSDSQADVAVGKTVILQLNGRFVPDELQRGGTLGAAADVTVLP
jgi:hypothetical protein